MYRTIKTLLLLWWFYSIDSTYQVKGVASKKFPLCESTGDGTDWDLIAVSDKGRRSFPKPIPVKRSDNTYLGNPSCEKKETGEYECVQNLPASKSCNFLSEPLKPVTQSSGFSSDDVMEVYEFYKGDRNLKDVKVVALGDLDRDGRNDIIVGTGPNLPNEIFYMRGFKGYLNLNRTIAAKDVKVADFNNDDYVDVLILEKEYIFLYSNGKDETFGEMILLDSDMIRDSLDIRDDIEILEFMTMEVADLDDSGFLDILVGVAMKNTNSTEFTSYIFLANAINEASSETSRFRSGVEITQGPMLRDDRETYSDKILILGDVDHNNYIDFIIPNDTAPPKLCKTKKDVKNVMTAECKEINGISEICCVGDVNGDSFIDLIVQGDDGDNRVVLGSEDGPSGVYEKDNIVLQGNLELEGVGDVNGDGTLDIFGKSSDRVFVHFNIGGAIFTQPTFQPINEHSLHEQDDNVKLFLGDPNGDKIPSFISYNKNKINVFLNTLKLNYKDEVPMANSTGNTNMMVAEDVDRDGYVDLISCNEMSNSIAFNKAGIDFESTEFSSTYNCSTVIITDIGDTRAIVFGNREQDHEVYYNVTQNGTNIESSRNITFSNIHRTSASVIVEKGDDVSVVFGFESANFLQVFSLKDTLETPKKILLQEANWSTIAIQTLPDRENFMNGPVIMVASAEKIIMLRNTDYNDWSYSYDPDEVFLPPTNCIIETFVLTDIYDDWGYDLLIGLRNMTTKDSTLLSIFKNSGDGFDKDVDIELKEIGTKAIAVADVTHDNLSDIIIGSGDSDIVLLRNSMSGFSTTETVLQTPKDLFTTSIVVSDVTADGWNDIVLSSSKGRNYIVPFEPCPHGGSQIHPSSWCFGCPTFMGNKLGSSVATGCEECLPDIIQEFGRCTYSCQLGQRKFGEDECTTCKSGTFYDNFERAENDTSTWDMDRCVVCESGSFANSNEFIPTNKCQQCPFPLSSVQNSSECNFCQEGFYMIESAIKLNASDLFAEPNKSCKQCPQNTTTCTENTSIYNMKIKDGFWRASPTTTRIYKCLDGPACDHEDSGEYSKYCSDGHKGPRCSLCEKKNMYFNEQEGQCKHCPSSGSIAIVVVAASLACLVMLLLGWFLVQRFDGLVELLLSLSIIAKAKILVGFIQILSSFSNVYGAQLHEDISFLNTALRILSFDVELLVTRFLFAPSCFRMSTRFIYICHCVWPFFIVGSILTMLLVLKRCIKDGYKSLAFIQKVNARQVGVVILYFTFPSVVQKVFEVRECQSFEVDDAVPVPNFDSYLRMDMNIMCDEKNDSNYMQLLVASNVLFVVWSIMVPLFFLQLLLRIKKSIRLYRPSSLALSCSFLWRDYDKRSDWTIMWEFFEILRRIFLTGFMNYLDTKAGRSRILRLVFGGLVSLLMTAANVYVKPYQRGDDQLLSTVSNVIVTATFFLSIPLNICGQDSEGKCAEFVHGAWTEEKASMMVAVSAFVMLVTTVAVLFAMSQKVPISRLRKTKYPPNVEMPTKNSFHFFMSHRWDGAQDITHAITRKMKLHLPSLQIWLDVDNLLSTGDLEKFIEQSVVIVIVYSPGYFRSKNCRREFFHAILLKKPTIVLYDGDDDKLLKLVQECKEFALDETIIREYVQKMFSSAMTCETKISGFTVPTDEENILNNRQLVNAEACITYTIIRIQSHVETFISKCTGEDIESNEVFCTESDSFDVLSLQWLKEGQYSSESLKLIYLHFLKELPYYSSDDHRKLLDAGIDLPDDSACRKRMRNLLTITQNVSIELRILGCNNNDVQEDLMESLRRICPNISIHREVENKAFPINIPSSDMQSLKQSYTDPTNEEGLEKDSMSDSQSFLSYRSEDSSIFIDNGFEGKVTLRKGYEEIPTNPISLHGLDRSWVMKEKKGPRFFKDILQAVLFHIQMPLALQDRNLECLQEQPSRAKARVSVLLQNHSARHNHQINR